jgi:hypothetical protein
VHAAETSRTCAAHEPQQKGFGLVVFRVCHSHDRRTDAGRCSCKEIVPRVVRRLFDRHPTGPGKAPDVDALDVERNTSMGAEVLAERLIRIRIGAAQLMIQVHRTGKAKSLGRGHLLQHNQQRDRIGASRERDDRARPPREQTEAMNRSTNGVEQGWHR